MKRKLTAILSLCICAFLLVPALALAQEPVSEIQVLTYDNDFFDDVIADFESKNPDIKVIRKLGQGIDTGATVAMLSSDDAPDVLLVNSGPGRVLPLAPGGSAGGLDALLCLAGLGSGRESLHYRDDPQQR